MLSAIIVLLLLFRFHVLIIHVFTGISEYVPDPERTAVLDYFESVIQPKGIGPYQALSVVREDASVYNCKHSFLSVCSKEEVA